MTARTKRTALERIIAGHGPMLISFSGGVDSTLLAAVARDILGERARCVLLDSPVVPRAAVAQAREIAAGLGLTLDVIPVPHMENREFCANSPDRCYFCKKISAGILRKQAGELGITTIADGMNVSDTGEHRPGLRAAVEEGILHPFIEAGITKQDIRDIARERGLSVWNKPSAACLSSRIPYGDAITTEKLKKIEEAEAFLAGLGTGQLRVRLHGNLARIEVLAEETGTIIRKRELIVRHLRSLGFAYVTLDLAGYRSGSMDEVL